MKKLILCLFFILCFLEAPHSHATSVQGYFETYCFKGLDDSSYVETSVNVLASTLTYKPGSDKKFTALMEITIAYMQDSTVKKYFKYQLSSIQNDTGKLDFNFIDLKRTNLREGKYNIYTSVRDLNNPLSKNLENEETINFSYPPNAINFSSVKFLTSFEKTTEENIYSYNGYDLKPTGINFFPDKQTQLSFYAEVYGLKDLCKDTMVNFIYSIQDGKGNVINELAGISKQKTKKVNAVIATFDISSLLSCNYNLVLQIKDMHQQLLAEKKQFFMRQKNISIKNIADLNSLSGADYFVQLLRGDSINFYLQSLTPIASGYELDFIHTLLNNNDTMMMKKYMAYFWMKREQNNGLVAWLDYKHGVDFVEEKYSAMNKHGWETDRGRVVLQYGLPNDASGIIYEAGAHPYDVWHYYKTDGRGQANVRFVFYDPETGNNDFKLIYSDAVGEVKDDHWKNLIYNQWGTTSNLDQTTTPDYIGKKIDDYFNK